MRLVYKHNDGTG